MKELWPRADRQHRAVHRLERSKPRIPRQNATLHPGTGAYELVGAAWDRQVGGHDEHRHALSDAQFGGKPLQALAVARAEHEVHAAACQLPGNSSPMPLLAPVARAVIPAYLTWV